MLNLISELSGELLILVPVATVYVFVGLRCASAAIQVKGRKSILKSGKTLNVDFLVLGIGVKPSSKLAEDAGLKVDNGKTTNLCFESREEAEERAVYLKLDGETFAIEEVVEECPLRKSRWSTDRR